MKSNALWYSLGTLCLHLASLLDLQFHFICVSCHLLHNLWPRRVWEEMVSVLQPSVSIRQAHHHTCGPRLPGKGAVRTQCDWARGSIDSVLLLVMEQRWNPSALHFRVDDRMRKLVVRCVHRSGLCCNWFKNWILLMRPAKQGRDDNTWMRWNSWMGVRLLQVCSWQEYPWDLLLLQKITRKITIKKILHTYLKVFYFIAFIYVCMCICICSYDYKFLQRLEASDVLELELH